MARKNDTETGATEKAAPVSTFTKEQLVKSARYAEKRDALTALLKDGKEYSHADVERLYDEFMKGKVK